MKQHLLAAIISSGLLLGPAAAAQPTAGNRSALPDPVHIIIVVIDGMAVPRVAWALERWAEQPLEAW
jgi:hypothetical protein